MLADVSKNGSIGITGVGAYVPEKVMTNEDLASLVATSDEWITERTGIKERHIAAPGQAASDLALPAAREALEQAGVAPAELDLVVETAGAPVAVELATQLCRPGGRAVLLGIAGEGRTLTLTSDLLVAKDIALIGSIAYPAATWSRVVGLVSEGVLDLDPVVTHHFPIRDFEEAVRLMDNRSGLAVDTRLTPAAGNAERAAALDPRSASAARRLGTTLLSLRRYPEAESATRRGLSLAPTDLSLIHQSALLALAQGDRARAERIARTPPPGPRGRSANHPTHPRRHGGGAGVRAEPSPRHPLRHTARADGDGA